MGNLEAAVGDYNRAIEYFNRAMEIRLAQSDAASSHLALLYLCIGRVESFRKDFDKALQLLGKAESLFVQTMGQQKHYMA